MPEPSASPAGRSGASGGHGAAPPATCRFELHDGLAGLGGRREREGEMRPARARDEARALSDFRVLLRPESFPQVLFARVIVRLGGLERVDAGLLERLTERDRERLEALYLSLNGYGEETAAP